MGFMVEAVLHFPPSSIQSECELKQVRLAVCL